MRFSDLIEHLDSSPGIYMMLARNAEPIYIGKAKDLKKRLKQYFQGKASSHRILVMLSQVHDLKVIVTQNEAEALILENKLIKEHQPKYNILLKDDKSFPYLMFHKHQFPRLQIVRSKRAKGDFFGPYTNQGQARIILDQIQRVFQVRNCSDHFFRNRTRPCIQYEIGRCKAPCVELVDVQEYKMDIQAATYFLQGSGDSYDEIFKRMQASADAEDFERAAACRDLLQGISSSKKSDHVVKQVFYIEKRGMQLIVLLMKVVSEGVVDVDYDIVDVDGKYVDQDWLVQYIYQYYQLFSIPNEILASIDEPETLRVALGHKVRVGDLRLGKHSEIYKLAKDNLQAYMKTQENAFFQWPMFWEKLQDYYNQQITKIICIDVSHNQGSASYAAMVVCGANGMDKGKYRSYKMNTSGDDCLAISQALERRAKAGHIDEETLVIIDGGIGQINSGQKVLGETGCLLTSISKGPAREWGKEKFYRYKHKAEEFRWPEEFIKYILHIRDEAHHFSVKLHRRALRKQSLTSLLDLVEGIGKDKKKKILQYFGGLNEVQCAKMVEIEKVPGVGPALAKRIYQALHIDRE